MAYEEIASLVEKGKKKQIGAAVQAALDAGGNPNEILDTMIAVMDKLGEQFQRGEVYVPEMLVAARSMQAGVAALKPVLGEGAAQSHGKFIVGTVKGDQHDIGKNLVALMVESAGFEIIDLGVDVAPEAFVQALRDNPDCHLMGLSSLLTTSMPNMEATVKAICEAGLREQVKIMVGGAPITQAYCDQIGADAYTADAGSAAQIAKALVA